MLSPARKPKPAAPAAHANHESEHVPQAAAPTSVHNLLTSLMRLQRTMGNRATQTLMTARAPVAAPRLQLATVTAHPVLQRGDLNLNPIDPESNQNAVQFRGKDTEMYCIGTVDILANDSSSLGYAIDKSSGQGKTTHAERNALDSAMKKAKIVGFNNAKGKTTGTALKQGGAYALDVYTEMPPCADDGCEKYMTELASKLDGDVTASYSKYLDRWYKDGKAQKKVQWQNHLDAIGVSAEPQEDVQEMEESDSDSDTEERVLHVNAHHTSELYEKVKLIFDEFRNEDFWLDQGNPLIPQTAITWRGQPTPEAFKYYLSQ